MDDDASTLELRDYLSVIRRRKWVIALTALGVLALAMGSTFLQTPTYQASARVLLQQRSTDTLFNPNTGQQNDPTRAVQTEIQVIKSRPVQDKVQQKFGPTAKAIAFGVGQTNVIEIRSVSTSPKRAAEVANAFADAYITARRQQTIDDLVAAITQIQSKITEIDQQLAQIDAKSDRRAGLLAQQSALKQKLNETQVDSALETGGARLVNPAVAPSSPFSPAPTRNAILGLFVGLLLGVAVAFGFEYFDDSIKSSTDLDRAVGGQIPTRALIPVTPGWKRGDEPLLVSLAEPTSAAAEAYRTLRTNTEFLNLDRPAQVIQFTSPSEGEGKTTTLANLGVAFARAGQDVLVVCADLRRPRLHEFFGLNNWVGLTSVILGQAPMSDAVQKVTSVDGLTLLSSGPLVPNPAEVLATGRGAEVLGALRAHFDVILIDCPPVLPVTDAAVVSRHVDATLVVARAGKTTSREIKQTIALLQQVDAPVAGLVLNGLSEANGYKHYRYDTYVPRSGNGTGEPAAKDLVL